MALLGAVLGFAVPSNSANVYVLSALGRCIDVRLTRKTVAIFTTISGSPVPSSQRSGHVTVNGDMPRSARVMSATSARPI